MNMMKTCVVIATLLFASQPARAQQANVNLDWNPHKNVQNLNPYGANVISPEVRDDQHRHIPAQGAGRANGCADRRPILLAVGKGSTPIPFEKGADGVWTLTVGPLKPNLYIYRLLVDGVAVVDPNNTFTGFSDQPGYSTVVVHGDGPAYYDAKPVPHGSVTRHVYHSTVLNGEREMYVYTPPNYDRNRRYPVLYLLGGSGELASTWNIDGRAGFIADNLIAEGKALPMIIAMPNNQVVHRGDPEAHRADVSAVREGTAAAHHPGCREGLQHAAWSARARHRRSLDGGQARAARRLQVARPVPVVRHPERR